MGRPGFEPGTNRLKAEYSTVELATHYEGSGGNPSAGTVYKLST